MPNLLLKIILSKNYSLYEKGIWSNIAILQNRIRLKGDSIYLIISKYKTFLISTIFLVYLKNENNLNFVQTLFTLLTWSLSFNQMIISIVKVFK